MRITFFAVAAFVATLAMPVGAYAQANQPPAARSSSHTNPSPARLQHRWTKRFGHLNLSGDQQQRVQSIINQYSQAHPQGSPRDPGSARELRHQLMGVLSSDQQNQFRQEMQARRAQMRQRYGQMQQGGAQNDQGAPDQRYQQGPDQQQYQQGPPQQYQQGPPISSINRDPLSSISRDHPISSINRDRLSSISRDRPNSINRVRQRTSSPARRLPETRIKR